MRVYHYVSAHHGLQNLRKRRLKVSMLDNLNDPFDLVASWSADPRHRDELAKLPTKLAKTRGMLCFSSETDNPVQWAHYSDRHRGLCLGFDVPDRALEKVKYAEKPISSGDLSQRRSASLEDNQWMLENLTTKFSHWSYEQEWRRFVCLETECVREGGLYFRPFDESLVLKEVLLGARTDLCSAELECVLAGYDGGIETHRMVKALDNSFRFVRQPLDANGNCAGRS